MSVKIKKNDLGYVKCSVYEIEFLNAEDIATQEITVIAAAKKAIAQSCAVLKYKYIHSTQYSVHSTIFLMYLYFHSRCLDVIEYNECT